MLVIHVTVTAYSGAFKAIAQQAHDVDKRPEDKEYGLWVDADPEYAAREAVTEFFRNVRPEVK